MVPYGKNKFGVWSIPFSIVYVLFISCSWDKGIRSAMIENTVKLRVLERNKNGHQNYGL